VNRHRISFENLIDWVDERLDRETHRAVATHLASRCPLCEADLSWIRRVIETARSDDAIEPPADVVARAKAIYRPQMLRTARRAWLPRLSWSLRLGLAVTA